MNNIDEAALKAERAVHKNHLPDLHYVLNVLEKVREFMLPKLTPEDAAHGEIAASITGMKYIISRTKEADTVVPAEQAEDSAMRKDAMRYRWLTKGAYIGECFTDAGTILEVHGTDKCVPIYGSVDEAIDAAIGRNREAGNADQG